MKVLLILAFGTLLASSAISDSSIDLGTEIGIMPNSSGEPSLGVQYTYGDDPDGKNYFMTFTPAMSPDEKTKHFIWNCYIADSSDFLMPWDNKRETQLATVQLKVRDKLAVERILKSQSLKNGKNMAFLVFADRNTKSPIYFLPISQLCADLPKHFVDLTNGKACDQITNP